MTEQTTAQTNDLPPEPGEVAAIDHGIPGPPEELPDGDEDAVEPEDDKLDDYDDADDEDELGGEIDPDDAKNDDGLDEPEDDSEDD